jgi:transcriptional regulator with XRE-family HTH domain
VVGRYLSQIERGLRKPSADVLQQVARVLSTSADAIYPRAAGTDRPDALMGVVEAIRADDTLTDEQKDSLVQIYESFRATAAAEPAEAGDATRNRRTSSEVD